MSFVHIVTVGASLAVNFERERGGARVSESEVERKLNGMNEAERAQYRKGVLEYLKDLKARGRLGEGSAELNAFFRYFPDASMAYLVHTDTELGRCCAQVLREFLSVEGVDAVLLEVKGLHDPSVFHKGLANLIREISLLLVKHRGNVRICATGGYKPEIALASVLGFISRAPIYYIHESFRQVIHLPALPIDWKLNLKAYGDAVSALLAAEGGELSKRDFIDKYGYEALEGLKRSWLIEDKGDKLTVTEVSKAILEAMQTLRGY